MSNIYTATVGTNSEVFPDILKLYVPEGSKVADVTHGKGIFWQKVTAKYELLATDLKTGVDMRKLPYDNNSIDCVVIDPPYMPYKNTGIEQISEYYGIGTQPIKGYGDVLNLYCDGIKEAERVLTTKGVLIIKCQDMVWSNKQKLLHLDIVEYCKEWFKCEDIFIVVQGFKKFHPSKSQIHARKNHSYFLVFLRHDNIIGWSK
jgi:tRNA G10  N-methylase Trm11